MYTITLDMVLDVPTRNRQNNTCVQGDARKEITDRRIMSKVLEEHGPGGGNPVVRLRATRAALERYIREVYAVGDSEMIAETIAQIKREE